MGVGSSQEKQEYCERRKTGQCYGRWDREKITLAWVDGQRLSEVMMLKLRPE